MTTDDNEAITAELAEAFGRMGMTPRQARAAARGRDYVELRRAPTASYSEQQAAGRVTQIKEALQVAAADRADNADADLTAAFRKMGLSDTAAREAARGR